MMPIWLIVILITLLLSGGIFYLFIKKEKSLFKIIGTIILSLGIISGGVIISEQPTDGGIIEPNIVWKDNCQVRCIDGKCNRIIGRTPYANDTDNQCKKIEEAKSLKNSPITCVVEADGEHLVECLDYNLTAIELNLQIKDKLQEKSIPLSIIKPVINVSIDKKTGEEISKIVYEEKSKENLVFNDVLTSTKEYEGWIPLNSLEGEFIKFGENSTTIQLQDADTENLEDTYIDSMSPPSNYGSDYSMSVGHGVIIPNLIEPNWRSFVKFNTSGIPESSTINNADLYMYIVEGSGTSFVVRQLKNLSWDEGDITWNNQFPAAQYGDVIDTVTPAGNGWYNANVTSWVSSNYSDGNLSFFLNGTEGGTEKDADYFRISTKESTDSSKRIYLNITYTEAVGESDINVTYGPEVSEIRYYVNWGTGTTAYDVEPYGQTSEIGIFKVINNGTADGNLQIKENISYGDYCYQETYNVSTACGGLNTGNYSWDVGSWTDPENGTDGDWNTMTTATTSIKYYYFNTTIPSSATTQSIWSVKDYSDSTVHNISTSLTEDCFTGGNTFQGRVRFAFGSFFWECWNYSGLSWEDVRGVATTSFFEEGIYWDMKEVYTECACNYFSSSLINLTTSYQTLCTLNQDATTYVWCRRDYLAIPEKKNVGILFNIIES